MVRRLSSLLAVMVAGVALLAGVTNPAAAAPAAAGVPSDLPGGTYVPVAPARVLDTRSGLGAPSGTTTRLVLTLAGRGGVPTSGVGAVVLNLTVPGATHAGYLAVSTDGYSSSSNVNYTPGRPVAQLAVSRLDAVGRVVLTSSSPVQMVADVVGWFTDPAHASSGATYRPAAPRRLYDSRSPGAGALVGGLSRRVPLTSVPAGATAVAVNLTAIRPTGDAFLTAWGSGPRPGTSSLNVARGDVRSNRAIVPIAADRSITVFLDAGRADIAVDLSGWFTAGAGGAGGSRFAPMEPRRLVDTRDRLTQGGYWSTREEDPLRGTLQLAAKEDSPVSGAVPPVDALTPASAAWLSFTVIAPASRGWLAVAPTQAPAESWQPTPGSSDVNFGPGVTPNAVLATPGVEGRLSTTDSSGPVAPGATGPDLVIDLAGIFYVPAAPAVGLWRQGNGNAVWGNGVDDWNRLVPGVSGDVVEVAGNSAAAAALLRDGTVLVRRRDDTTPTVLTRQAAHLASSIYGFYVVARDGSVWTDDPGEGMHGVPGRVTGFAPVPGVDDVVSVAVGRTGAQAVRRDGSVVAWGGPVTSTSPAATPVTGLLGPVQSVAVDLIGGRSVCRAYRDGRVEVRLDSRSPYLTLSAVDAVSVVPAEVNGCFAQDRDGAVHRISAGDGVPIDTVLPGVTAAAMAVTEATVLDLGGQHHPLVRVLATDGTVRDRVGSPYAVDGRWAHVPELDGATAIGGSWSLVTWVPPAG